MIFLAKMLCVCFSGEILAGGFPIVFVYPISSHFLFLIRYLAPVRLLTLIMR